jgi:hypothetical protein
MSEARDPLGRLVLQLSGACETTTLRWAGDLLERSAGAEALDRFQAPDQKYWDYRVRGVPVTLHWISADGLFLEAGDKEPETERQVRELAGVLQHKLVELSVNT